MADFLLLDGTDYLLLDGTDRLILSTDVVEVGRAGGGKRGLSLKRQIEEEDEEILTCIRSFLERMP